MKKYKSLLSICAFAALANCAKADIDSAQEQYDAEGNLRGIVIHNPTAAIGEGEKQVKTPWMIMTPDGKSAFANEFTTNAISVVSENGTDYYAHIEGENGDRTKVIHFTVNENGIPSKNGDVIDTTESGEEKNAEKMKIRKLIGVNDGYLYFYPTDKYGTSMIYNYHDKTPHYYDFVEDSSFIRQEQQKAIASYSNGFRTYVLYNGQRKDSTGNVATNLYVKEIGTTDSSYISQDFSDNVQHMFYLWGDTYIGSTTGKVYKNMEKIIARLPGPVSGLSHNYRDIFATTPATNAFYNVTKGQYNVATDQNGNVKPMIPKTKDGLIKVIDNRRNGGKFLCITTKGAHTIDD